MKQADFDILESPRRRANGPVDVAAEVLEERTPLSAPFGSVLGVGSTGTDIARGVTTDESGNTYVTGELSGTVIFSGNGTAVNVTEWDGSARAASRLLAGQSGRDRCRFDRIGVPWTLLRRKEATE